MSRWDYPPEVTHYYEVECDRAGCGTLSAQLKLPDAFAALVEEHEECRPCVVTVLRRGRPAAKKRSKWVIWLHRGPHIETEAA